MTKRSRENTMEYVGRKGTGSKKTVLVLCVVFVVLLAAYPLFCWWAGNHVLPNTEVAGVDLSAAPLKNLEQRLEQAEEACALQNVVLSCGGLRLECPMAQAGVELDAEQIRARITVEQEEFWHRGAAWLKALGDHRILDEAVLSFARPDYVRGVIAQLQKMLDDSMPDHQVQVGETSLHITKGTDGLLIDVPAAEQALRRYLAKGNRGELGLAAQEMAPTELDFDALLEQVWIEAVDAALDPETMEVVPHVDERSFDVQQAKKLFSEAQPLESIEVPLIFTSPEVTTDKLNKLLFADVLGQATSWVSGSLDRLSNVALAGRLCHDVIILPGEEFSFWNTIAPCDAEQGFLADPNAFGGLEGGMGAGIDQVASSVYTCAFYANLEVLERSQHRYAVGYLPDGSDAMIGENGSDLRFVNNTKYPIKIQVLLSGRTLTVQFLGSKTDNSYVRMESTRLSTTNWKTEYWLDENVPEGTKVEVFSAYTGRQVEIYRCVYAGDGTLISRTFESLNDYQVRNPVVKINPADAEQYGLEIQETPNA